MKDNQKSALSPLTVPASHKEYSANNTSGNKISDMKAAAQVYSCIYNVTEDEALTMLSAEYHNIPMAAALEEISMKERDYYLNKHKYAITPPKPGVDDRYRTHLDGADGKRHCVRRKKLEDLENIIINYYKELDTPHSITAIKDEFLEDRKKYVRDQTVYRDYSSYDRFFDDSSFTKKDIRKITAKELSDYRMKTVIRLKLGVKETQRLQSLLNAIWDYAVSVGYADTNIARILRSIGTAFFNPNGQLDIKEVSEYFPDLVKKYHEAFDADHANTAEELDLGPQYYTGEEQTNLIKTCYQCYKELNNTAYLAIIMCFCLGLRIGELVGLKVSDFDLTKELFAFAGERLLPKMNLVNGALEYPKGSRMVLRGEIFLSPKHVSFSLT